MAKTIPGGLTLNAAGDPQNAAGQPVDKKDVPEVDGLSATIMDLDKRAAAIEAKQPVQRFVLDPAALSAATSTGKSGK